MERQSLEVSHSMCKSRRRETERCCTYLLLLSSAHRARPSVEVQGTAFI